MDNTITPVILCGGSGTRLWPLSRKTFPKQFLKIGEKASLFQSTLLRLSRNPIYGPATILTNNDHRFLVAEQARQIGVELGKIFLEPAARNTAAAIATAAFDLSETEENAIIHVMPSDHLIEDDEAYRQAVYKAAQAAEGGNLVTFGIEPTYPAIGYGYIKAGDALTESTSKVAQFVEKPPLEKAEAMLAEGGYFWNSGMFMFRASDFVAELIAFEPEIAEAAAAAVKTAEVDLDFVRLGKEAFEKSPDISVDYAVFERTQKAAVVPAKIKWSDIGSWKSLWESEEADDHGNVVSGDATLINAKDNFIVSEGQQIALNGVSNLTVVATDDAVLVSAMDQSEQIKDVVAALKASPDTRVLTEEHKTIYRPWGGYTSILNGERFQVKKLFVDPGKKLSLQKHHHRAEHWVVVSGTAEVTVDDKIHTLSENESVYIPLGAVHRLANPGKIQLEVIEVQSGSYLGEDDIIRIEDDFGRGAHH